MCLYLQTVYQATWWCQKTSAKVVTCMEFSLNTTALTASAAPALEVSNPQTACESTCLVHNFLTCADSFFPLCFSLFFTLYLSLSLSLLSVCLSVCPFYSCKLQSLSNKAFEFNISVSLSLPNIIIFFIITLGVSVVTIVLCVAYWHVD